MRNLAPVLALLAVFPACAPQDADGDGIPALADCNDADAAVYPGANEICDGVDNDCNSVTDDDYAKGGRVFFQDGDGDGFGVWARARVACNAPAGYVPNADDCADDDAAIYPAAPEFCDKIDQNCNGEADDDAVDAVAYYSDFDQDGYGGIEQAEFHCEQPTGFIRTGGDCNDFNPSLNPQAVERCDLVDNNCNGVIDEAGSDDATPWYGDKDRDGFGAIDDVIRACYQPEYYTPEVEAGDCDDNNDAINPGATEVCWDRIDNNCNGSADKCDIKGWSGKGDRSIEFQGVGSSAYFGRDMDFVGDVNGDGFDDVVFGGYRHNGATCTAKGSSYCGGAALVYGRADASTKALSISDAVDFNGSVSSDYFGWAVEGVGDLNGDGFGDFMSGAYFQDYGTSSSGSAYIIYGGRRAWEVGKSYDADEHLPMVFGRAGSDYLGYSLGGPGDINGDGYDDAIIGAPLAEPSGGSSNGVAYVLYGSPSKFAFGGAVNLPAFHGEASSDNLGYQPNGLGGGDFNGDGFADLLMGAYNFDYAGSFSTGKAYVLLGDADKWTGLQNVNTAADMSVVSTTAYAYTGYNTGSVGDMNGDGYEDFYVSAYGFGSYAGRVAVYMGSKDKIKGLHDIASAAVYVDGPQTYEYLGQSGAGGHDLDNDGFSDLVVTNYYADLQSGSTLLYSVGAMYVFKGGEGVKGKLDPAKPDAAVYGTTSYQYLGYGSVASHSGDFNGDGWGDTAFGSYYEYSYAGAGYVFFGVGI